MRNEVYIYCLIKISNYNCRRMNQSTEGRLRSKYESSNRKIKALYQEFESLKSRINTPGKNRKAMDQSRDYSQHQRSLFNAESEQLPLSIPRFPSQKWTSSYSQKPSMDFETKTFIKNSFQKFLTCQVLALDKKVDQRCEVAEERIENLTELLSQIHRLIKLKGSKLQGSGQQRKCQCKWKGEQVKEIEKRFQKKMDELTACYENKISLLVKDTNNDTSASSTSKRVSKQVEEELKNMEQKLMIKDNELTELKLQATRLRRISDSNNKLIRDKEKLLEELSTQIQDKQKYIKELEGTLTGKNDKLRKQFLTKQRQNQTLIKNLNEEIQQLNQTNQRLQTELNHHHVMEKFDNSKFQIRVLEPQALEPVTHRDHKSDKNESELEKQDVVLSDFEEDAPRDLNLEGGDDFEPLRHSHFVNPSKKKKPFHLQKKIKELESQLQLISEENRLLKDKKDKFEEQVKENQSDEQKFQLQSQILRDQLKRINKSLKDLDECAVAYFHDKKVAPQKVQTLDDTLLFKKELKRKFPLRKNSISKSIK